MNSSSSTCSSLEMVVMSILSDSVSVAVSPSSPGVNTRLPRCRMADRVENNPVTWVAGIWRTWRARSSGSSEVEWSCWF